MLVKTKKEFSRMGVLQPVGSIIEVPPEMLDKLADYIAADNHDDVSDTWRPEPKAWLTDSGELRTQGVFEDLVEEIIRLTTDNLPLQSKLLRERCGEYSGPRWNAKVEEWGERAGIMQYDGTMSREEAELEAAKLYRMEAFLDELRQRHSESCSAEKSGASRHISYRRIQI